MTWSIRDRAVFDRFRTEGRHLRVGALWCTWIADPDADPPRVAYAVGRAVGGAVVRNRVRRRLRARVARAARDGSLGPGWYLVGASPSVVTLAAVGLDAGVAELVTKMRGAVRS